MGKGFRDLKVWESAMELAQEVYAATSAFPASELYGMSSQMRRAAVSVPCNIAEGHGRGGKEFARFLDIAYGSAAELETQIELALRLQFLQPDTAENLIQHVVEVCKMLHGLRASIRRPDRNI